MEKKLTDKILNHLLHAKTADGRVGCRVQPREDTSNFAWLSIVASKTYDTRSNIVLDVLVGYSVEYLELNAQYDENQSGMDYDLYFVKKEVYYNIKDHLSLYTILGRFLEDFSQIEPIANTDHPVY
jgi:hypothetical protein